MIGLSGILTATAVFLWAGVVAFWSRRWSVWAITFLSLVAYFVWAAAIESGRVGLAVWGAGLACCVATVIVVLFVRNREESA